MKKVIHKQGRMLEGVLMARPLCAALCQPSCFQMRYSRMPQLQGQGPRYVTKAQH